jgi:hypothetical protein
MLNDGVRNLHQLAHAAVCGQLNWPASPDRRRSIWQMLADSGVTEQSDTGAIRFTNSGARAELELLLAAIGAINPWDIPFVLQEHGYASEEDLELCEAETEAEGLRRLKLLIFQAYTNHFVRSISRH